MLFIEIAILSVDKPNHQLVHPVREKINVKNWCQNHGIQLATLFHRYTQAFSANILGIYMYSWFASHAVEYGVNAFCIHIYRYANEKNIGNNIAKNQIFFLFKFHPHAVSHSLYLTNISQIISHRFQRFFLSYRIINPNHRKRIRLTIQYNNQIHNKI